MSNLCPLHRLAAQHFDERFISKQNESFLSQAEHTIWVSKHRTLKTQYFHLGDFLWKQYKFFTKTFARCSFCLCTPLLTLTKSFFTSTYLLKLPLPTHLQKRLLLKEVFKWWKLFFFSGAGFVNISPTFLIACEVQTRYSRILKYSEQYIRDHLSGA